MADNDVILLEDEAEEEQQQEEQKKPFLKALLEDKKKLAILIGATVFLLLIILVIIFFAVPKDETEITSTDEIVKKLSETETKPGISLSKLDHMIKKANILYERGVKQDALLIYQKIAGYSESVSYYNLGVAQMKEQSYKQALDSFQKAINSGEDRCVAAINAAVCSLYLKEDKLFGYYIDLAYAFLKDESASPLYSYYYALILYYKNYFYEALSPLQNKTTDFYEKTQDHMASNIFLIYNDNDSAIKYTQKLIESSDYFPLGLMYARTGQYELAATNIIRALGSPDKNNTMQIKAALELVNLKRGYFRDASTGIGELAKANISLNTHYPINVKLSDALFDIGIAQKRFAKDFDINKKNSLKILFYFTGYKIFDAERAKNIIEKGSLNIYVDEIGTAKDLLKVGGTVSEVNQNIAIAIRDILDHKLRAANTMLQKMQDRYKNHPILHFDLGLSYAQLGDYEKAYYHFLKSYHLDNSNIIGGIYAIAAARLTNRDYQKLLDSVTEDLDKFSGSKKENDFYIALINFIQSNPINVINWGHADNTQKPLQIAIKALSAYAIKDMAEFDRYTNELQTIMPKDLMVGILRLLAEYSQGNIKDFSLDAQSFFRSKKYSIDGFYFGPAILRELYVRLAYITGAINYLKDETEDKLQAYSGDTRGLLQAASLVNIYTRNFEEAFVGYTTLIDNLKVQDSNTLFYGAAAAIGAGHHENAAANLELSILTDKKNYESRYALGLLYQESDNAEAASIQFGVIGNGDFKSEYFDFYVDPQRSNQDGL